MGKRVVVEIKLEFEKKIIIMKFYLSGDEDIYALDMGEADVNAELFAWL